MNKRIIIVAIVIVGGALAAGLINHYYYTDPDSARNRPENNRLTVINPNDVNDALVDPEIANIKEGHVISDFSFTNQLGNQITQKDLEDQIYVANFFFTTCGGICPKMSRQLQRVQKEFAGDDHFKILSHTVNPSVDSVQKMFDYAKRFEADNAQWWFLTGPKEDLYLMARRSYLVVPDEEDPNFEHGGESDFIHTENVVLIDPEKRIRGMYDCTSKDEVSEMIKDVYDLKREYGHQ